MSDDNNDPKLLPPPPPEASQPAPGAPSNQLQTAPCPLCQHPLTFILPSGTPFRHPQGTILFFPHPTPIRCSECGQHYTPIFLGAQGIAWNWQPCPPPADAARIIPVSRPVGSLPFQRRKP